MTTKEAILNYLHLRNDWLFGGEIENIIAKEQLTKASTVSRRLRELANEGKIERALVTFQGNRVVKYRILSKQEQTTIFNTYNYNNQH